MNQESLCWSSWDPVSTWLLLIAPSWCCRSKVKVDILSELCYSRPVWTCLVWDNFLPFRFPVCSCESPHFSVCHSRQKLLVPVEGKCWNVSSAGCLFRAISKLDNGYWCGKCTDFLDTWSSFSSHRNCFIQQKLLWLKTIATMWSEQQFALSTDPLYNVFNSNSIELPILET